MKPSIKTIIRHAEESEKMIEKYLDAQVRTRGGITLKFSSSIDDGFPDRIAMLPGGRIAWFEVKSKGAKPRPLQMFRHEQLRDMGQRVYVVDSRESINTALNEI